MAKKWESYKHEGMSKRLASRLYLFSKTPPSGLKIDDVMEVAYGVGKGTNKRKNPPSWWKRMDAELVDYDPSWVDFTSEEKKFIVNRMVQGVDRSHIRMCLAIPDIIFQGCVAETMSILNTKASDLSDESIWSQKKEDFDYDFLVNAKLDEYKDRIDLSNPVNVSTLRMMIVLEAKLDQIGKSMLNISDVNEVEKLSRAYAALREQFSKAAGDVAQLEKQREIRVEGESLDDVIATVINDIGEWRNIVLPLQLEELGLIKHMVALHKVELFAKENTTSSQPSVKDKRKGEIAERKMPVFAESTFDGGNDELAITE